VRQRSPAEGMIERHRNMPVCCDFARHRDVTGVQMARMRYLPIANGSQQIKSSIYGQALPASYLAYTMPIRGTEVTKDTSVLLLLMLEQQYLAAWMQH
jgi:hypothetical protein